VRPVAQKDWAHRIRELAVACGFDSVGITSATEPWSAGDRLEEWVADGFHGDMGWLETTLERRKHPTAMWKEAKTAIALGLNYGPDHNPLQAVDERSNGAISVYAQGRDYHDVVKSRLKALASAFASESGADVKVFVDTAPLLEKPLAQRAGIGWQGKHTNLVSRELGSWLFLGFVLTTVEMESDAAETDHCGTCRTCLDVCPTEAFPEPYRLDARRCISYLTIEHSGPIPVEYRSAMGNRIYGCDDCLAVCPWNKFAQTSSEVRFHATEAAGNPPLNELLVLDDAAFRLRFSGSPIKRIGRDRFLRNVLVAAGNSADASLVAGVRSHLSDLNPVVRGAAIWALSQLVDADTFSRLRTPMLNTEPDSSVRAEWG
jgi:epoxyqueuosine reductase